MERSWLSQLSLELNCCNNFVTLSISGFIFSVHYNRTQKEIVASGNKNTFIKSQISAIHRYAIREKAPHFSVARHQMVLILIVCQISAAHSKWCLRPIHRDIFFLQHTLFTVTCIHKVNDREYFKQPLHLSAYISSAGCLLWQLCAVAIQ